jgi:competence protein ComGC
MKNPLPHHPSGKTLIELLVVLVIIALLATLIFPLYGQFKARASYAGCVSNMTSLHGGFALYLNEHQMVWPTVPAEIERDGVNGDMLAKFWFDALKDYGITQRNWLCPGDDHFKNTLDSDTRFGSTYSVTEFDDQPNRAYQWVSQPWIIESAEFHGKGKGPNVIYPDGRIDRGLSLMAQP